MRFKIGKRKFKRIIDQHRFLEDEELRKYEYPEYDDAPLNKLEEWFTGDYNAFSKSSKIVKGDRLIYYDKKGRFTTSPLTDYIKEKNTKTDSANGIDNIQREHIKEHGKLILIKRHKEAIRNYIHTKKLHKSLEQKRKTYRRLIK